jgi:sigma-E factor negative regulatory protein RseA
MRSQLKSVPDQHAASAGDCSERVSSLMDGELDASELEDVCHELRDPANAATWTCYHVIGDAMRGSANLSPGFSSRFAERLAAEPTIPAPQRERPRPLAIAWAAAATVAAVGVVGWVSFQTMNGTTGVVDATAQAYKVRPNDVRPAGIDREYLLVHQEYSPTTALQGARPYMRAVAAESPTNVGP